MFDGLLVAGVGLANHGFLTWANFSVIFEGMALPAVVLVPTVFLLAAGRFDLSPDGVSAATGMITGLLMKPPPTCP